MKPYYINQTKLKDKEDLFYTYPDLLIGNIDSKVYVKIPYLVSLTKTKKLEKGIDPKGE